MDLPKDFIRELNFLKPSLSSELQESLQRSPVVSIRLNQRSLVQPKHPKSNVPWSVGGYYLDQREIFNSDPLWHAGVYYVQEASSMVLGRVVSELRLKENKPLKVLDLCASPGGKSTDLANVLADEDLLMSNEAIKKRVGPLIQNVVRWGRLNHFVTNNDPADFQSLPGFFDLVIVDAPCSGEGLFRKDPKAICHWSLDHVKLCHKRQVRILSDVWSSLKPGGYLIFSTCTFNRWENEETLHHFADSADFDLLKQAPFSDLAFYDAGTGVFRALPSMVRGEGFSFAILRKLSDDSAPRKKERYTGHFKETEVPGIEVKLSEGDEGVFPGSPDLLSELQRKLRLVSSDLRLGQVKKGKFIPAHRLAMWPGLAEDEKYEFLELNYQQAISYLRKETFPIDSTKALKVMTYRGHPLGWINHLGNRFNNGYPANMRIMTQTTYNQDPEIL